MILNHKFNPFYKFPQDFVDASIYLQKMIVKLIEISKNKIEKGEKLNSMLDHMIGAYLDKQMSEEELKSNVFIFFVAGHETTANTLSFLLQLTAKNQEIQEKMRKEVIEQIGANELPTNDSIKKIRLYGCSYQREFKIIWTCNEYGKTCFKGY